MFESSVLSYYAYNYSGAGRFCATLPHVHSRKKCGIKIAHLMWMVI